jgi:hypothetical protein
MRKKMALETPCSPSQPSAGILSGSITAAMHHIDGNLTYSVVLRRVPWTTTLYHHLLTEPPVGTRLAMVHSRRRKLDFTSQEECVVSWSFTRKPVSFAGVRLCHGVGNLAICTFDICSLLASAVINTCQIVKKL